MNETASLFEIFAAIVNAIGLLAAGRMMHLTLRRLRAVMAQPDRYPTGREILAAWRHIRCESGRILLHVMSFGLSVWAMSLPDNGSAYGMAAMGTRLILGSVFTVLSFWDLWGDDRLWALIHRPVTRGVR